MRCKNCHYSLEGLTEHRCPECGSPFDPNDPFTYGSEPKWRKWRPVHWVIAVLLTLLVLQLLLMAAAPLLSGIHFW